MKFNELKSDFYYDEELPAELQWSVVGDDILKHTDNSERTRWILWLIGLTIILIILLYRSCSPSYGLRKSQLVHDEGNHIKLEKDIVERKKGKEGLLHSDSKTLLQQDSMAIHSIIIDANTSNGDKVEVNIINERDAKSLNSSRAATGLERDTDIEKSNQAIHGVEELVNIEAESGSELDNLSKREPSNQKDKPRDNTRETSEQINQASVEPINKSDAKFLAYPERNYFMPMDLPVITEPQASKPILISLVTGLTIWDFDLGESLLANERETFEKVNTSSIIGLHFDYRIKRDFSITTGVELLSLRTKFNKVFETMIIDISGTMINMREVQHFNNRSQILIPLLFGYQKSYGKYSLGFRSGPTFSKLVKVSGKYSKNDELVDYDLNSGLHNTKPRLGLRISAELGYSFENYYLSTSYNLNKFYGNLSMEEGINFNPDMGVIQIGLGFRI